MSMEKDDGTFKVTVDTQSTGTAARSTLTLNTVSVFVLTCKKAYSVL